MKVEGLIINHSAGLIPAMILQIDQPAIQAGTLLIAAATFFGALAGASIQFYLRREKNKKDVRNLRAAFLAELKAAEEHTAPNVKSLDLMEHVIPSIPTRIFENNIENIGKLETDEVESLVEYYSNIQNISKKLEFDRIELEEFEGKIMKLEEGVEEGLIEEGAKEEAEALRQKDVEDTMESYTSRLDEKRRLAIQSLEQNPTR